MLVNIRWRLVENEANDAHEGCGALENLLLRPRLTTLPSSLLLRYFTHDLLRSFAVWKLDRIATGVGSNQSRANVPTFIGHQRCALLFLFVERCVGALKGLPSLGVLHIEELAQRNEFVPKIIHLLRRSLAERILSHSLQGCSVLPLDTVHGVKLFFTLVDSDSFMSFKAASPWICTFLARKVMVGT